MSLSNRKYGSFYWTYPPFAISRT